MKKRLDLLLVERGLVDSRTRAQALVLEGKVRVDGQVETKPGITQSFSRDEIRDIKFLKSEK